MAAVEHWLLIDEIVMSIRYAASATLKILALIFALLTALPAWGQVANYPQTLPANSVVGRLGKGPGPAQAIPFAALQSNLGGNTPAATIFGNPTSASALQRSFTIQGLPSRGTPDTTNDRIPIYNSATGALNQVAPASLISAQGLLLSVCNTASSFLWNSAGTWVCQSLGQVSFLLNLPISLGLYSPGGTSNDTTGVQAAFTACSNAGGCSMTCPANVTYTINTITLPSNVYLNGAGCTFKQRANGTNTFDVNGVSNVHFDKLKMIGTATPGGGLSVGASVNSAILIRGSSDRVWVTNSDIREFLYYPVEIKSATNIYVTGNYFYENVFGPRCSDGHYIHWNHNTLNRTALYSLTPIVSQFAVGLGLDSTDPIGGVSYNPCTDVEIIGNVISGFPYAQAILVHAGSRLTISGNTINGSSIGISLNPYNSTDVLSYGSISSNTIEGTTASSLPANSGDSCITVQAGGSTPNIIGVVITGNVGHACNRIVQSTSLGCFQIGYTEGTVISGNLADGCGANAYIFADAESGISVTGNVARNTVAYSSIQNGFNWLGTPVGTMMGNTVIAATVGYKIVGTATGLKYKDSGSVLLNGCSSCTTANSP